MIDDHEPAEQVVYPKPRAAPLVTAAVFIVAIAGLYVGAGIFVPLVMAVLLAFALAPLVDGLRRLRVPHVLAVVVSVAVAALVLAAIAYVVATQLIKLAVDLPSYQATVGAKLKGLQAAFGGPNFLDRLGVAIDQLRAQVSPASIPGGSGSAGPLPVTLANNPENPLGMAQSILGSILGPMATAAIVVVFLVFLLLQRGDLRDRFLKLVSRGDLRTSTKVMDEAGARVGRYLLVQFTVNLSYGIIFGAGLTLIGVPSGILWGLLATLFRYVPFVGTMIIALIPFTLAFAIDPGWSMLLESVALYLLLEAATTNLIEPRLYGSSTGLSPLAVLVAAMFWATLWGPLGLILSTPLTVCLVVLGRYVPQLQFLETLLGSRPVLRPEERLYQRLVAGNTEEAADLAERYSEENGADAFYDDVALPALRLAEADLSVDPADIVQRRRVVESLEEVIDELEAEVEPGAAEASILVIGGRTELDGVAARILVARLHRADLPARILPPLSVRAEAIGQLETAGIKSVCLVYLGAGSRTYARFVARRLRRQHPDLRITVCLLAGWTESSEQLAGHLRVDAVVPSVPEAVRLLREWQTPAPAGTPPEELGQARDEIGRLKATLGADPRVADFLHGVAEQAGVAVAVATVAESEDVAVSTREHTLAGDRMHGSKHLMDRVVETGDVLVVADAFKDKVFADDAFLLESGVRFYAGAPLRDRGGEVIGVLAIMDETPRELGKAERAQLQQAAVDLMSLLDPESADAGEAVIMADKTTADAAELALPAPSH